jgi:hypothetical protein
MNKVIVAVVLVVTVLLAGLLSWNAEATTSAGIAGLPAAVKNSSLIKKTACAVTGKHCPPGYIWTCNAKKCWCARC